MGAAATTCCVVSNVTVGFEFASSEVSYTRCAPPAPLVDHALGQSTACRAWAGQRAGVGGEEGEPGPSPRVKHRLRVTY